MNNRKCWQVAGALFSLVVGSLLHFVYDWSGQNTLVSYFSPVNESVWEHLKLLFVPIFFFTIIEYLAYGKELEQFFPVKIVSMVIGMLFVVVSFYTYTGIMGDSFVPVDIALFSIGILIAYIFSYRNLENVRFQSPIIKLVTGILLALLLLAFFFFTTSPPHLPIFQDPLTLTYGRTI
ncbi:DUF6512 family protein [Anaerosporobacter faecicola]|uniref:DUF6512 family protein n=1 Tax=Anaerosporobacter faecicola TaxID=2718714 RepID=UPI00143A80DA|nr:DUF6512 family protein [Anaerosporobacter faecicola]